MIDIISETGFWDSPFFVGLLTLTGVVAGAVLAAVFNARRDGERAKREARERYLDRQLEYCSVVLDQAKVVQRRLSRGGWPATKPTPLAASPRVREARAEIKEATDLASNALASLSLIAPESIRSAARSVIAGMLRARVLEAASDAKAASDRLAASIERFEVVGRKHFGVVGEEPSQPKSPAEPSDRSAFARSLAWLTEPF